MTLYSVQLTDWIFGKRYWFLSFAKSVGKNIGKNINNENVSSKSSQRLLDHSKQSPTTSVFKAASKKAISI